MYYLPKFPLTTMTHPQCELCTHFCLFSIIVQIFIRVRILKHTIVFDYTTWECNCYTYIRFVSFRFQIFFFFLFIIGKLHLFCFFQKAERIRFVICSTLKVRALIININSKSNSIRFYLLNIKTCFTVPYRVPGLDFPNFDNSV